jgi:hypothetical protein
LAFSSPIGQNKESEEVLGRQGSNAVFGDLKKTVPGEDHLATGRGDKEATSDVQQEILLCIHLPTFHEENMVPSVLIIL